MLSTVMLSVYGWEITEFSIMLSNLMAQFRFPHPYDLTKHFRRMILAFDNLLYTSLIYIRFWWVLGINAPTSQSFLNYVLLAVVYGCTLIYRKKALKVSLLLLSFSVIISVN